MAYGFYIPGTVGFGDTVLNERDPAFLELIVGIVKDSKHVVFLKVLITSVMSNSMWPYGL